MNWISVTDRMPWGPDRIHMIDVPRGSHNDVTHWMPLPANPTN